MKISQTHPLPWKRYSLRPITIEPIAKKKCLKIIEPFHFPIQY